MCSRTARRVECEGWKASTPVCYGDRCSWRRGPHTALDHAFHYRHNNGMALLGFGWRKEALRRRVYAPSFRGMYDRLQDAIDEYARPEHVVLDAGCGSGRVFQHRLAGRARRVVGVDVTDELHGNPNIDDSAKADLRALPLR